MKIYQRREGMAVAAATNRLLKLRLQNFFGEAISFFKKSETSSELIYSNNPSTESFKEKLLFSTDTEKVENIAKIIRKEINECEDAFSGWPTASDELTNNFNIPPLLEHFLKTLFTNEASFSDRVERLVKSVGQDIIYNISRGKNKK